MNERLLLPAVAALLLAACATTPNTPAPPLRVGFSPNYPPVCYHNADGAPAGLEYDLAKAFAQSLRRDLEIVEMAWDRQIPALLDGQIDIVMSGISPTPSRAKRVAFSAPYMKNPIVAVVRTGFPDPGSARAVLSTTASIGALKDTSAESLVRATATAGRVHSLATRDDAARLLLSRRIDYYVDDFSAANYIVSRHPDYLSILPYPLQPQSVAWAVAPSNRALLAEANAFLARSSSSFLPSLLRIHLPYLTLLDAQEPSSTP